MTATAPTKTKKQYPTARPKVPAYARYEGTSAWRKDRRRARAYAWYLKHEAAKAAAKA